MILYTIQDFCLLIIEQSKAENSETNSSTIQNNHLNHIKLWNKRLEGPKQWGKNSTPNNTYDVCTFAWGSIIHWCISFFKTLIYFPIPTKIHSSCLEGVHPSQMFKQVVPRRDLICSWNPLLPLDLKYGMLKLSSLLLSCPTRSFKLVCRAFLQTDATNT